MFVYSFDRESPEKQERAKSLIALALSSGGGSTSFQVMQEFVNLALGKFRVPLSMQDCRAYLDSTLVPLCRVFPDSELLHKALDVRETTGFSFYDSLILAAAVRSGSAILFTEDLQAGKRYEGLTVTNPF